MSSSEITQPTPMELGEDGLYIMRTQADVLRVAQHLLQTGAVPSSLRTAQQVAMAVQGLKSLGLNPYAAIRQVAFINGAMTLWGDLPLALARKTTMLEDFEEFRFCIGDAGSYRRQCFVNSNCHLEAYGAVCRIKRQGQASHEVVYTQDDAKRSGLWGKTPTWRSYPARMMQMRARSQALKDVFSDALAGVQIQEFDVEGIVAPGHAPARAPNEAADLPRRQRGGHVGRDLLAQFTAQGITADHVETYLGHSVRKCTIEELEMLRELAIALANQDINWADALMAREQQMAGEAAEGPLALQEPTSSKQHDSRGPMQAHTPSPAAQIEVEAKEPAPALRPSQVLTHQLRRQTRGPARTS